MLLIIIIDTLRAFYCRAGVITGVLLHDDSAGICQSRYVLSKCSVQNSWGEM